MLPVEGGSESSRTSWDLELGSMGHKYFKTWGSQFWGGYFYWMADQYPITCHGNNDNVQKIAITEKVKLLLTNVPFSENWKKESLQLSYIHTNSPNHIYIIWIIYIIYYLLYCSKSYYLLYCKALTLSLTFAIFLFFPLILFLLSLCFWYPWYLYTISLKAKKGLLKEYTETFFSEYTRIIYIYIYIYIYICMYIYTCKFTSRWNSQTTPYFEWR